MSNVEKFKKIYSEKSVFYSLLLPRKQSCGMLILVSMSYICMYVLNSLKYCICIYKMYYNQYSKNNEINF